MDCINTSKYTIYNDLSGQEAAGGDLCVTALKPDIVKIDTQKKQTSSLDAQKKKTKHTILATPPI